jgi:hypothetical protein
MFNFSSLSMQQQHSIHEERSKKKSIFGAEDDGKSLALMNA